MSRKGLRAAEGGRVGHRGSLRGSGDSRRRGKPKDEALQISRLAFIHHTRNSGRIMDDIDQRIALRIRVERQRHALTIEALAERSGVSRAMISRIERGEARPTAALLGRLCAGLGLTSRSFADDSKPAGWRGPPSSPSGATPPPATSAGTWHPRGTGRPWRSSTSLSARRPGRLQAPGWCAASTSMSGSSTAPSN